MRRKISTRLSPSPLFRLRQIFSLQNTTLVFLSIFFATQARFYDTVDPFGSVIYHKGNLETMLLSAQEKNKAGLVSFYADYCYPCSATDALVASRPDIVAVLNDQFVNYKVNGIDAQSEGKRLARTYNITTYPTFLITDAYGKEIMRFTEYDALETYLFNLVQSDYASVDQSIPLGVNSPVWLTSGVVEMQNGEKFEESDRVEYGLQIDQLTSLEKARDAAAKTAEIWSGNIWIHPSERQTYKLILGTFSSIQEAKITRAFLHSWEGIDAKTINLSPQPLRY